MEKKGSRFLWELTFFYPLPLNTECANQQSESNLAEAGRLLTVQAVDSPRAASKRPAAEDNKRWMRPQDLYRIGSPVLSKTTSALSKLAGCRMRKTKDAARRNLLCTKQESTPGVLGWTAGIGTHERA